MLSYSEFARQLYETCIINDPWLLGEERFSTNAVLLSRSDYTKLEEAALLVGALYDEFCAIIQENPGFVSEFFMLSPFQKLMWFSSQGRWHGIARLDLFILPDGSVRMCEMNSDTPSGEAEAVILNHILHPWYPGTSDPNSDFRKSMLEMVEKFALLSGIDAKDGLSIGIVYPTDLPEDLSMILLYRKWLEEAGYTVVSGSPNNISRGSSGYLQLLAGRIDIVLRHYKTDWWAERRQVWSDIEKFPDQEPFAHELYSIIGTELEYKLAVINPFGAVLTQNKLSMAFFHRYRDLFSERGRQTIDSYVPESHRACDVDLGSLDKDDWVLKSDYGCEGDEVIIGRLTGSEEWRQTIAAIIPEHWIVQRFFTAAETREGFIPNYGLYLIGGRPAGIFTRLSKHATDYSSVAAPTFISEL